MASLNFHLYAVRNVYLYRVGSRMSPKANLAWAKIFAGVSQMENKQIWLQEA